MDLLDVLVMRTNSGTSWQPDSAPMAAVMAERGDLGAMVHGQLTVGVDAQGSKRGDTEIISTNWFMGRGWARSDRALIEARVMLSAEPLTAPGDGYPLLLQTGETWQGKALHDTQHPHDLVMELAVVGRVLILPELGVELYAAPAGEPAIGPGGYPHRPSGIGDPLAPLGHHWQDATHITYGVLTAGLFGEAWKLEGSWFNGAEPDEDRWGIDLAPPDSGSARLTINPHRRWSAQGSYAYLASPEAIEPGPVERITASTTYTRRFGPDGFHATTAAWGRNFSHGGGTDTLLVESTYDPLGGLLVYGRGEYTVKSAHDLVLEGVDDERVFGFPSASAGVAWGWEPLPAWVVLLGVRGNASVLPADLEPFYGTRVPVGGMVYLQTRPAVMSARHDRPGRHAPEPAPVEDGAPVDPAAGGHGGHGAR